MTFIYLFITKVFLSLSIHSTTTKTNNWSTNALIIWPLFYFFCWKFYFGYILQGLVFDYICRTFESFFQFFFWIIVLFCCLLAKYRFNCLWSKHCLVCLFVCMNGPCIQYLVSGCCHSVVCSKSIYIINIAVNNTSLVVHH